MVDNVCSRCGAKLGWLSFPNVDVKTGLPLCSKCSVEFDAEAEQNRAREAGLTAQVKEAARNVVLTSTPSIDGYRVRRYLGFQSVEIVIGSELFPEPSQNHDNALVRRSTAVEKKRSEAKTAAINDLRHLAAEKGANAVVAVDLDYWKFSETRVVLVLQGTLVEIEPIQPDSAN